MEVDQPGDRPDSLHPPDGDEEGRPQPRQGAGPCHNRPDGHELRDPSLPLYEAAPRHVQGQEVRAEHQLREPHEVPGGEEGGETETGSG